MIKGKPKTRFDKDDKIDEYAQELFRILEKKNHENGFRSFVMGCDSIWRLLEKFVENIDSKEGEEREEAVQMLIDKIKRHNTKIKQKQNKI